MGSKMYEARFTIKFDPANPRQREAMRILNEAGRRKAALITDAILYMFGSFGVADRPHSKIGSELLPHKLAMIGDSTWQAINESVDEFF